MTSTKKGYLTVTGFTSFLITKAFRLLGAVRKRITAILDYGIQLLGKSVSKFDAKKGSSITTMGYAFTDKREQLFGRTAAYLSSTANIVKNAYEHKIVTLIVPVWSSIVGLAMLINIITKGIVVELAFEIPTIGKYLAAILSGGLPLILGVLIVASASALIALAVKSDDIVGSVIETEDNPVATSEIKDVQNGEVTITVTGDVTPELAEAIAEKHVEVELAKAEAVVKEMSKPQTPTRKPQPSRNKKKK
jgi:hypothetical protein